MAVDQQRAAVMQKTGVGRYGPRVKEMVGGGVTPRGTLGREAAKRSAADIDARCGRK